MIDVRCRCGEVYHADPQHAGRSLRCRCGRKLKIAPPAKARSETMRAWHGAQAQRLRGWWSRRGARGWSAGARRRRPAVEPRAREAARWIERLGWGYLALAVVAALMLWGGGDRWWFGTALLFGPRWVLLLPLPPLLLAASVLRPRALAPLGVALLVVLIPFMGLRLGGRGLLGGGSEPDLRIVSLNAADRPEVGFHLLPLITAWQPSLLVIQECGRRLAPVLEQLPGWHFLREGNFCLLSRHPAGVEERMRLPELDVVREVGLGGTSTAVRYLVETPGRPFELVNLHLETPRKGLEGLFDLDTRRVVQNTLLREIESRRASQWIGTGRADLIIAGDFNMPVESRIYRASWGEFDNAFSRAGFGFGMTRDNGRIRVRIDHILTGRNWRARRAFVGPDVGSDHWPLVADLRWVGPE